MKNEIKTIDEEFINEIVEKAFELEDCNNDDDLLEIRKDLYKSKYSINGLEEQEKKLNDYLDSMIGDDFEVDNQGRYYKKVMINYNSDYKITTRLYIAPNPINMHEMIKELVSIFVREKISVYLKFQLTTTRDMECDRMVIYANDDNKEDILKALNEVSNLYPKLFLGCERSIMWIYESRVKGVYITPGTIDSYGAKFIEAISNAKKSFDIFYKKLKNINKNDCMKVLVYNALLVNDLLLRDDDETFKFKKYKYYGFY